MNGWFTIEKIDYKTFVISEYQHWEQVHSYLIIGSNKAILLDTGLGVANIKDVVDKLTTLPIHVITTHAHWDHIGSHSSFNEISVHYFEKEWLEGKLDMFYPTTNPMDFMKSIQKVAKLQVERILPVHYSLEVNNDMIGKIQYALEGLYQDTKLVQGYGIVEYDGFGIQL